MPHSTSDTLAPMFTGPSAGLRVVESAFVEAGGEV